MRELFNFRTKVDLTGYTLIFPSISVGNVPQLTIDLLISSLNLKIAATIWHPAILSCVGSNPFELNNDEICTACELYINEDIKLATIQLRSTIDQKLAIKFFDDLKFTLITYNIKEILVLASSFDYEMHQVTTDKYFYISNQKISERMSALNIKPKEVEFNGKYLVHGSGFAVKLYETLNDKLNCTILIKYVSEGDNRPDAISTVDILSKILDSMKDSNLISLKFPPSWSGVFGGPPPIGMY